ncbi:MAG: hypothetical protein O6826_04915 [Acidobacteria bacterium]|nr:hypothetical protein [Acidobacteriota bacterium]
MKLLFVLSAGLLLPVIILWSLSSSSLEMSLEWELAVINAGEQVPADHPTVSEFRILMDRLEKKCSSPRREIGEICITAHLWRKERGSFETLLEFTESVDRAIPPDLAMKMDLKKLVQAMLGR